MGKWPTLGLGQGKFKMSLEYLVVPESKKKLQKQKDRTCQRDASANLKVLPVAKPGTI